MIEKQITLSIRFTEKEFDLIQQYQEKTEAITVQDAILNAISLAMNAEVDDGR